MMQRAAFAIAAKVRYLLKQSTGSIYARRILLLVGPGDNGGDALWAGSYLLNSGVDVRAVLLFPKHHEVAYAKYVNAGGRFLSPTEVSTWTADICLDGIFGIGGRQGLSPEIEAVVSGVDTALLVAIDVPSAYSIACDMTLMIGDVQRNLLTGIGREVAGIVDLIDMGPDWIPEAEPVQQIALADLSALEAIRLDNAHKYQRGVVAIHAGSTEYPGAGVLAAAGARFSGVGLVTVIGGAVSAITERFPEVVARELDQRVGAIAVGSGDSISKSELVELLATDIPLVVDAGALSFLSDAQVKEQLQARAARGAVTVLTPHEGEAKKLGVALDDRYAAAQLLANDYAAIVVLKGPGTVISAPNEVPFVDSFGTKALATAGSGDVLAGLIAAALASWPEIGAHRVVASAVALHGLAGRLAPHNSPALEIAQSLPLAYATI